MLQGRRSRVRVPMRRILFNLPNPSTRTMALGSTQPLTEMSTRNLPGGKGRPARMADNLASICEPTVWKMWKPRRLTTLWASKACYRNSFTFYMISSEVKLCALGPEPKMLVLSKPVSLVGRMSLLFSSQ
jgi:hypothetical protein